jgi:hypothetical protein
MSTFEPNRAVILTRHVSPNARVFANRHDLIDALAPRDAEMIAEVGVALGDFSEFLIKTLTPRQFVAFDLFEMHKWPEHWGRTSQDIFGQQTHLEYFERRFASHTSEMKIEAGMSRDTLLRYPSCSFDMIYVDANHGYDDVMLDARLSGERIKSDGLLVFNDYTLYDPFIPAPYGVVHAVNELIAGGGWQIVGFALEVNMFCDIALRRTA